MIKIRLCRVIFLGSLLYLLTSCLGGDNYKAEDWMVYNAQIGSFKLSCDSIPGLEDVKFTIDQVNGKIYNKDSMRYGTTLGFKALAEVTFDSPIGVRDIYFITASNDTVKTVTDSIDFSAPVMITVTAYNGSTTKVYKAWINVHQVNPDTLVWQKMDSNLPEKTFQDMKVLYFKDSYYMYAVENEVYQLYRSELNDHADWEELELTGFPLKAKLLQMTAFEDVLIVLSDAGVLYYSKDGQEWKPIDLAFSIETVLGYLPASTVSGRKDVLCCVAEVNSILKFVSIDRKLTVIQGKDVPETFPVTGFGQFHYETMYYPRLAIASGRTSTGFITDKAWATMDGLTWALLTYPHATFVFRDGAAFFYYGQAFFIIGGIDASGKALKDIYFSIDQGVTWLNKYKEYVDEVEDDNDEENKKDEVFDYDEDGNAFRYRPYYILDEAYEARGFSSVIIDKNNYIMLFGGKATKDTKVINEIWRGRINRLGFGKD